MTDRSVKEAIAAASNALFPEEACGFILGYEAVVSCANVAEEPCVAFRIDPSEADHWWGTGWVTGVWHSHPGDPAVPSEADQALAVPGIETWIYSVPDEDLGVYLPDEAGRLQLVRFEGPE